MNATHNTNPEDNAKKQSNQAMKTKTYRSYFVRVNLTRVLSLILLATAIFSTQLRAQTSELKSRNVKSTVNISSFESINLSDGRIKFNFPLVSLAGRGIGNGVSVGIERQWNKEEVPAPAGGTYPEIRSQFYGFRNVKPSVGGALSIKHYLRDPSNPGGCPGGDEDEWATHGTTSIVFNS